MARETWTVRRLHATQVENLRYSRLENLRYWEWGAVSHPFLSHSEFGNYVCVAIIIALIQECRLFLLH